MKKQVNGYAARSDKLVKVLLVFILAIASLMPLTVSAGAASSTTSTITTTAATATPTPTPIPQSHEVTDPVQQQATPSVSWNS